ncbi:hypothetical protein [Cerasicoccus arenae]|uniref:Uncharacterized protein n=1 Tax=Cerasicoccus arenae TaxID=424488 RepID=A0A8J3DHL3_9BACT|nr:hypothetical protein [Cerasicoccus arenae]MBK1859803.1 hypothetical protein [Cerasicoccus arenae]GHB93721.1 hypothetical protein GCM10007047_06540 [Cerasicoccus arenae]
MEIADQLKALEAEKKALAAREKELKELAKEQKAAAQKLEQLVKASEYETPKALVEALIEHYGITFRGRKKGSGAKKADGAPRRRRTKVTAELRDAIKNEVAGGTSMNKVAKAREISYSVIAKICKGDYDKV